MIQRNFTPFFVALMVAACGGRSGKNSNETPVQPQANPSLVPETGPSGEPGPVLLATPLPPDVVAPPAKEKVEFPKQGEWISSCKVDDGGGSHKLMVLASENSENSKVYLKSHLTYFSDSSCAISSTIFVFDKELATQPSDTGAYSAELTLVASGVTDFDGKAIESINVHYGNSLRKDVFQDLSAPQYPAGLVAKFIKGFKETTTIKIDGDEMRIADGGTASGEFTPSVNGTPVAETVLTRF